MAWIVLGLVIAFGSWFVLRYAQRTDRQLLASFALWGIWIGGAIVAIGLAMLMLLGFRP